jgi:hypothetical protein
VMLAVKEGSISLLMPEGNHNSIKINSFLSSTTSSVTCYP